MGFKHEWQTELDKQASKLRAEVPKIVVRVVLCWSWSLHQPTVVRPSGLAVELSLARVEGERSRATLSAGAKHTQGGGSVSGAETSVKRVSQGLCTRSCWAQPGANKEVTRKSREEISKVGGRVGQGSGLRSACANFSSVWITSGFGTRSSKDPAARAVHFATAATVPASRSIRPLRVSKVWLTSPASGK